MLGALHGALRNPLPSPVGQHQVLRGPAGGLRQETSLSGEVSCQLTLVTWSCATLLGAFPRRRDPRERHLQKIAFVTKLAQDNDIVLLQEAHGDAGDLAELEHRPPSHVVMGASVPRMLLEALQFRLTLDSWGFTLAGFPMRLSSLVGPCALL